MPTIALQGSVGVAGDNHPDDVEKVQQRLKDLGFTWVAVDGDSGPTTERTIKLLQAIINGHQSVAGSGVDGTVDVGQTTHNWLEASNAPRWQVMPRGSRAEGYENFEVQDTGDNHDYGTNWLADMIVSSGARYRDQYLNSHSKSALLSVNDASTPEGGNTPDHAGHETGLSCDLRLPRKNGSSGGIEWDSNDYDRDAMRAMLEALKDDPLFKRVLFNDTVLISEGLCSSHSGHDNHAHLEINPPQHVS